MELGIGELIIVALVIVVLFGPDKLPSIARDLGQGVRKMKSAMEDIKTEVLKEADNPISEIKKEIEKVKESVDKVNPMADVQKQIEDMKNSVNPMSTSKVSPASNSQNAAETNEDETPNPTENPDENATSQAIASSTEDSESQVIDPLSDEYMGPVSR